MPITKSAKKALRGSIRKKEINKAVKIKLRQAIRGATAKKMSETFSAIDKAAKANIIHKNKAARLKSRLSKSIRLEKAPAKTITKKTTKKSAKKATAKKVARKVAAKKKTKATKK